MQTPSGAFDWCLVASGFFVSTTWLFKRDWLEEPRGNRRILYICIILAVVGMIGTVHLFRGARTYLHCLVFPLVVLCIPNSPLAIFRRQCRRDPEDTFMRWGRGLGPDYLYNSAVGIIAFVGPMLWSAGLPKVAHQ